jgi:hypothetical protein
MSTRVYAEVEVPFGEIDSFVEKALGKSTISAAVVSMHNKPAGQWVLHHPRHDKAEVAKRLHVAADCLAPGGLDMSSAPRDGTHFLAYLYQAPDDEDYRGFGEWREIFYKATDRFGFNTPWHAGDPHDSHSGSEAPEHFGEAIPIAWLPLPTKPAGAKTR